MQSLSRRRKTSRGAALITSVVVLSLLAIAGVCYVDTATTNLRIARQQGLEIQTTHLCEAGSQSVLRALWRPFEDNQNFDAFDPSVAGASDGTPTSAMSGTVPGVGAFSAGVIGVTSPDTYTRIVTVRAVGWIDHNNDGELDAGDPYKTVDITATFTLDRSEVFDYTYFVNNYGWMDGFSPDELVVNGDMRANGNFNFTNGSPTVNGSVYAAQNQLLSPASAGLIDQTPVKWDNSDYLTAEAAGGGSAADNQDRWRQAYNPAVEGAYGSADYATWQDILFDTTGQIQNNSLTGSVAADATGVHAWDRTTDSNNGTETLLNSTPTQQVIMPDLSDMTVYQNLASTYVDTMATYNDGTPNPNYNQGSYLEVWNSTSNSYQTVTTSGNYNGSLVLIGTAADPIIVHGPIAVSQDVVILGNVSGQGTIYAGRNVQIDGSILYTNKPNFQGTNQTAIDNANQKADLLALAASGSIIMGDTTQFSYSWPLQYMSPPFTVGRYDNNGNWIPPFNAMATDSTGRMLYQSVVPDSITHAIAESVNQIDAVLYTNFVGGGNVGTAGAGVTFNGSIISKDEAIVVWSLPMRENYDTRIKERTLTQTPLIDLDLPRSPTMLRCAWQDRGFQWNND